MIGLSKRYYKQTGLSLIEVLVALVLLAVGLLGIAGLQLTGIRFTHNANLRYQAMLQALDMADRMRANLAGVNAGVYDNISGAGSDPGCVSSGCSIAQMAQNDAYQWNTTNAQILPNGAGTVINSNGLFTITVSWNEMEGNARAASNQQFQLTVQP